MVYIDKHYYFLYGDGSMQQRTSWSCTLCPVLSWRRIVCIRIWGWNHQNMADRAIGSWWIRGFITKWNPGKGEGKCRGGGFTQDWGFSYCRGGQVQRKGRGWGGIMILIIAPFFLPLFYHFSILFEPWAF